MPRLADAEVSRDNGRCFVTAFASMSISTAADWLRDAGHDNPYRLQAAQQDLLGRICDGDGPPLSAIQFPYEGARLRLVPANCCA
ncbi:MAG: hypothetical protein U5L03_04185 [Burkholderiaceae bacterium]|nr:hypothetical protein [Burkholderiaceae bacterium]